MTSFAVQAVTRVGDINAGGSDTEQLFLKKAAGVVLSMYEETNLTGSRINMKMAQRGAKSETFFSVGQAKTKFHEAGKNILVDNSTAFNDTPSAGNAGAETFLSQPNFGEREVFIDDPLESYVFIDNWEQFKSAFDASPPLMRELGKVIAVDNDKHVFRLMVRGAVSSATTGYIDWSSSSIATEFQPSDGQMNFTDANAGTDGSVLLDQIRQVAEEWDDNDVPEMGRYCALAPAHYNLLVQNQDLLNRDFGGQNGIFADGTVFKAWGIELLKSTHIPTTDTSAWGNSGAITGVRGSAGAHYSVDASGTVACLWQQEAMAGVRAGSIAMEKGYLMEYRGTLMIASLATGYDILRPLNIARIGTA